MHRNSKNDNNELFDLLAEINKSEEICDLMREMLTKSELETLSKRWRILKMLSVGRTQRDIAKELKVSLCKVTRGAQILKDEKSIVVKCLKEIKNEYK